MTQEVQIDIREKVMQNGFKLLLYDNIRQFETEGSLFGTEKSKKADIMYRKGRIWRIAFEVEISYANFKLADTPRIISNIYH